LERIRIEHTLGLAAEPLIDGGFDLFIGNRVIAIARE